MAQVSKTITVSTPVTRQVTSKNAEGEDVTKSVTEIKTETKTVTVEVPDENNDKKVDKTEFKNSEKYQKAEEKEQSALDRVYDKAAGDGAVDTDTEFDALAQGLAEHQLVVDSVAIIEKAKLPEPDDTSEKTMEKSQSNAEKQLADAEAALANIPPDHPERTAAEEKVQDLQATFTATYAERDHPDVSNLSPQTETAGTTESEQKTYEVKPGDNLSKIARENGITLDELKEANPQLFQDGKDDAGKTRSSGGNLIYPGDQVVIPQKQEAVEEGVGSEAAEAGEGAVETQETEEGQETEGTEKTEEGQETEGSQETEGGKGAEEGTETEGAEKKEKTNPNSGSSVVVDSGLDDNEVREMMKDRKPEEVDKLTIGTRVGMIQALDKGATSQEEYKMVGDLALSIARTDPDQLTPEVAKRMQDDGVAAFVKGASEEMLDSIPPKTRAEMINQLAEGETLPEEDEMIGKLAVSIAKTNPEELTEDVIKAMDDNGVRELVEQISDEDMKKLPAETLTQMIKVLDEGETTDAEDKAIGKLASTLAETAPEKLTPEVIKTLDDNGVRALMDHLDADELKKLPTDTRKAMIQELVDGATTDEEDALIGRIAVSIAETDPKGLTPELIHAMDDNGVRAMTKDMSVEDLSKLPRAVLEAMREELRGGWTTQNEYKQIDKITQALPNAK